jgi:hypothetical protein
MSSSKDSVVAVLVFDWSVFCYMNIVVLVLIMFLCL